MSTDVQNELSSIIDNPITNEFSMIEERDIANYVKSISIELKVISYDKKNDSYSKEDINFLIESKKIPYFFSRRNKSFLTDKHYSKTQKWKGNVISINENTFQARLTDLTSGGTEEIGEFELTDIPKDDKELLSLGATFYWSIGYAHENGQISKKSFIRFQRVLNWDSSYFESACKRAEKLSTKLIWD